LAVESYAETNEWLGAAARRLARHALGRGSRVAHALYERPERSAANPHSITAVTANDTTIAFDETGEYQFESKVRIGTASARRSRTYLIFQRQGQLPPSAP